MCQDREKPKERERDSEMMSVGTMQGIPPGRKINHVGVLDLRGVPAEHVAKVEEINSAEVILLDDHNRLALERVVMRHCGSVVVAAPDERVLVTPHLEITGSGMEAMPSEQKLLLLGNLFFRPDVPPALVGEKLASLRVAGILIACAGVHGALLGKMQLVNGVTIVLPDEIGPIVRDTGETRMVLEYVAQLPAGVTFLNFGRTEISAEVSVEMLKEKIAAYYNVGETSGPERLIALLQARCPANLGRFKRT